mgnify:CR=1 FL=1
MGKDRITYHYPVSEIGEDGKWRYTRGREVGRVLSDGSIENTPYRFKRRRVVGGIAVTTNSTLIRITKDHLRNPATGEIFTRTRKGTGFWGKESKVFVPEPYYEREKDD